MTVLLAGLAVFFLLCIPVAYWMGRRSVTQADVDRVLRRETSWSRLNDQKAEDQSGGAS
jgi:hypothetical protein